MQQVDTATDLYNALAHRLQQGSTAKDAAVILQVRTTDAQQQLCFTGRLHSVGADAQQVPTDLVLYADLHADAPAYLDSSAHADADAAQALLQAQTDASAYAHADSLQADVDSLLVDVQNYMPASAAHALNLDVLNSTLYALAQDEDLLRQAVQIVLQIRAADAGTL